MLGVATTCYDMVLCYVLLVVCVGVLVLLCGVVWCCVGFGMRLCCCELFVLVWSLFFIWYCGVWLVGSGALLLCLFVYVCVRLRVFKCMCGCVLF